MKSVLISIQPKYCELIVNGKKTIEVRKTRPKIETPFKCYIYCTIGNGVKGDYLVPSSIQCGKVIGEFVCDKVYSIKNRGFCFSVATEGESITDEIARKSCLDYDDMVNYLGDKDGYGWHISDLKIYDKPKELSEFRPICKFEGKDAICALFCPNWKYDGGLFFECTRKVTRPPQSWMYVEEIETR